MRHKGSRTGQRKKINYNAAATETSASHPMEGFGTGMAFQSCAKLRPRDQAFTPPCQQGIGCVLPPRKTGRTLGEEVAFSTGQAEGGTQL